MLIFERDAEIATFHNGFLHFQEYLIGSRHQININGQCYVLKPLTKIIGYLFYQQSLNLNPQNINAAQQNNKT